MMDNFRAMFARFMQYKGARDLWRQVGYPEIVTPEDYWKRYRRDGIANRIVKAYPSACWRAGAVVRDDRGAGQKEADKDFSPFALAWFQLEQVMQVYHHLERADRLARVGQYSILVMGFQDGKDMREPLEGQADLTFLSAYPEHMVTINQWETDASNPRYGLPVLYTVQVNQLSDRGAKQVVPRSSFTVHHSRVIHVAENTDDNDVFGEPSLRPVWNHLLDLEKVVASSAETFWLNARGGMAIEAASDSTGMATFSPEQIEAMRKQAQDYEDQLRRVMALEGATVKLLTTNVADPKPNIETLQALIAGTTGIPQRILFGSERGELASSQDENSWESRVDERRQSFCGPNLLEPFIAKMVETGNLIPANGDWWVEWPQASAASPEKEATIAGLRAQAVATYSNSAADTVVAPQEFRQWLGLAPDSDFDLMELPDDADDFDMGDDDGED